VQLPDGNIKSVIVLLVENTKGDFSVCCGYGGRDKHSPLFTASVSKLFVTACILILQEQQKLSPDDLTHIAAIRS